MTNFKKSLFAAFVLSLVAATPAGAATTFGNTTYDAAGVFQCNNRLVVSEMIDNRAPLSGVITKFTINPNVAGGTASFKVVNLDLATHKVLVTATTGQFPVTASGVQSKSARVKVAAGQYIGVWGTGNYYCVTDVMPGQGNGTYFDVPDPAVGFNGPVTSTISNERPLLSAAIEPDADNDGFGDETQDGCKGQNGPNNGCVTPTCHVPQLKGLTQTKAKSALKAGNCSLGKVKKKKLRHFTKKQKRNRVRSQSVAAGKFVSPSTKIDFTINVKKKSKKH